MGGAKGIQVVSAFGIKGGGGKSTLCLALAASIKRLVPEAKVGLVDMTTEQATLSARFAPENEQKGYGWWGIVRATLDDVLREENPEALSEAIRSAVLPLAVIPGVPEERGTIEFIGCGKRHLRLYENHPDVAGRDAFRVAASILTHLEHERGWDFAVVDLPPSTKEVGSRMMLPCCGAVAVVASATHEDDLAGYPSFIDNLRAMEVEPVGFLVNRVEQDASSLQALRSLHEIAQAKNLPVLGSIRQRSTIKRSRETAPFEGTCAAIRTGLYWAAANDWSNHATRAIAQQGIDEVEAVTAKLLASLSVEVG